MKKYVVGWQWCRWLEFAKNNFIAHVIRNLLNAEMCECCECANIKPTLFCLGTGTPGEYWANKFALDTSSISRTHPGCFSILICASSFPFLASFPRILAPPFQDAREGCTEKMRGRRNLIKWNDILAPFSVASERHQLRKMDLPLCC